MLTDRFVPDASRWVPWCLLTPVAPRRSRAHTGALDDGPGADYYTRLHPERAKRRAMHQLEALGYHVTLQPTG